MKTHLECEIKSEMVIIMESKNYHMKNINKRQKIPYFRQFLQQDCLFQQAYQIDLQQQLILYFQSMKLKTITSLLFKKSIQLFSDQPKKGKFVNFVKSAWKQTFPEQEDIVKQKYQRVKQEKRFTKQELEKIQQETPQYLRSALVTTAQKVKQEKQGFKISNLIPQAVKSKIKETPQYKEYQAFKQNLKEYASTREGVIANAGATVYSKVAQGSPESRATELMRQYIKDFSIYTLEEQSTVIFKAAYHSFLNEKLSELETMSSEQAYQYFSALIKVNRSKKWKPKFTEIIFNYPSSFLRAKVGEKMIPTFQFNIKLMEIYCYIDNQGKIIQGGEDRVNESIYQFSIVYSGEHIETLGHPWSICEIKKLQEMKMLV